jgi:hypothetical protein
VFVKKNWVLPAVLISFSFFGVDGLTAAEPQCYTLESLKGSWTTITEYGAKVGVAYAKRTIDENGNMIGVFVQNQPVVGDATGARLMSNGTAAGVYKVNCDGTGTITRTVTSSLGVVTYPVDDFIITKAKIQRGKLVATEILDAQRTPSALVPGGVFVTRIHTRVPDRAE